MNDNYVDWLIFIIGVIYMPFYIKSEIKGIIKEIKILFK